MPLRRIGLNFCESCGQPLPRLPGGAAASIVRVDGSALVVPLNAVLPDLCVKCGEPGAMRRKQKVSWHHPALYLLIVAGVFVYVIGALIAAKRSTVQYSLCAAHAQARKRLIWAGWGGLALLVVSLFLLGQRSPLPVLGMLVGLVVALYGYYGSRDVRAKKITQTEIRLGGVRRPFLEKIGGIQSVQSSTTLPH